MTAPADATSLTRLAIDPGAPGPSVAPKGDIDVAGAPTAVGCRANSGGDLRPGDASRSDDRDR